MKKKFVRELDVGENIDDVFVLTEKIVLQKKDGNNYINVTLSDKTGNIKGVIWDNVDTLMASVSSGDYVRVKGGISDYRGRLQLVVKKMETLEESAVNRLDFIKSTARNVDNMFDHLKKTAENIKNPHYRRLLDAFFRDENFVDGFKTAPAAKKMHHDYLGGLLEHTLSMAKLMEKINGHYGGIDSDLLMTGVILHDIGKIHEFKYKNKIDYSDEGRLLTHIIIGCEMVAEKIRDIPEFPQEEEMLIKHMIISHHGLREFGSPEPPKTIEAVLLNYIDEIDAKVNGIRDYMNESDPEESWTPYHRVLERHFYKGKPR